MNAFLEATPKAKRVCSLRPLLFKLYKCCKLLCYVKRIALGRKSYLLLLNCKILCENSGSGISRRLNEAAQTLVTKALDLYFADG